MHWSSSLNPKISGEGDGVSNWTSSGVIRERVRVMSIDAFSRVGSGGETLGEGDVGFGNGSSSGCDRGLWWLIMDEKDDELGICIWRKFIRRDLFENGMSLNWFRNFQNLF
ncbi:hypothetical protein Tco_0215409 [Tanacetum coccineum]